MFFHFNIAQKFKTQQGANQDIFLNLCGYGPFHQTAKQHTVIIVMETAIFS